LSFERLEERVLLANRRQRGHPASVRDLAMNDGALQGGQRWLSPLRQFAELVDDLLAEWTR
jgi:hypothetical protein